MVGMIAAMPACEFLRDAGAPALPKQEDSLGKVAGELAAKYRALAAGDFNTPVSPYRGDRCRARMSSRHWMGALTA